MGLLVLFRSTESQPTTGTAAFGQAAAAWAAVGTERITSVVNFSATATWSGIGVERLAVSASFIQEAALSGQLVLIIVGYASPAPPDEFLIVTGQLPPEEQ